MVECLLHEKVAEICSARTESARLVLYKSMCVQLHMPVAAVKSLGGCRCACVHFEVLTGLHAGLLSNRAACKFQQSYTESVAGILL